MTIKQSVIAVEVSGNRKVGKCSTTYASQASCHSDCPLKNNGCYAEVSRVGVHTHRLNRNTRALKNINKLSQAQLSYRLAREEARQIRQLTGERKLRVHVVGDAATVTAAKIVGKAMVEHEQKHGKPAWTYSHSWRHVPAEAWQGARVLASCESVDQVTQARRMGHKGIALIVPAHHTHKVYETAGINVIPCPAQFFDNGHRRTTCEQCGVCQNINMLAATNRVVGFQPDGHTESRVLTIIREKNT